MNPRYQLYKNLAFFFFPLFMFHSTVVAQSLEWAKSTGGATRNSEKSICVDNSGNIYTVGHFYQTVDFDPNIGIYNLTAAGASDIYIQKLDSWGNLIWAKSMGGADWDYGVSIAVDSFGNIYTTGVFGGVVDFNPNIGVFNLTSNGWDDIFIQKLDSAGNFIWAKNMGGINWDYGVSIALDSLGNVYTTGEFNGTVDFDPNAGVFNLTSNGWKSIFIQKLDASGNFIWAKSIGGTGYNAVKAITLDKFGNIYTIGAFSKTVDFDPNAGIYNITAIVGGSDIYIQKLDASGNFIWAKTMGGTDNNDGNSIVVDDLGNIYTTGSFEGTVDFDPSSNTHNITAGLGWGWKDAFIQKLDALGNLLWVKSIGKSVRDAAGLSISVDNSNNPYIIGYFEDTVDFDPNIGSSYLISNGSSDIFIQKLDTGGNLIWAKSMGGNFVDQGTSITLDGFNNIYTMGSYSGTVDFDPNSGYNNLTTVPNSSTFVQKLSPCAPNIDVVYACSSYTWIDGNTYTSSNNTATYPISNLAGCDTVMTLDLTINTLVDITTTVNDPNISSNETGASVSYQWLDCLNNYTVIPWATTQNITAGTNGSYAVEVTNGCIDTSACVNILLATGIPLIDQKSNMVSIFPNPSKGLINIKLDENKLLSIKVLTINGRLIYQEENINSSTHQFELDESSGVYIIEINTVEKRQFFKLIKN